MEAVLENLAEDTSTGLYHSDLLRTLLRRRLFHYSPSRQRPVSSTVWYKEFLANNNAWRSESAHCFGTVIIFINMPKAKTSRCSLLKQWIGNDGGYRIESEIMICELCGEHIPCEVKYKLTKYSCALLM
jgi:hypothetical protein